MKIVRFILLCVFVILFFRLCSADSLLQIDVLDIGEGDCILIQGKKETIMVDAGGLLTGHEIMDYLRKKNITSIDYLILTHPHPDHIAGAFFIVPKFKIENICDNGQVLNKSNEIERWYEKLVRFHKNYRRLSKGDVFNFSGFKIEVLWPGHLGASYNDNSLVLMLSSEKFSCLFAGDLSNTGEKELLEEKVNLKADILKVGHHGNNDATSAEFLSRVSPRVAVITQGYHPAGNLPSEEVINLLKERKIQIYRNDLDGNIVFLIDESGNFGLRRN